ncbi:MAG: ribonuclease, partial [Actinomycetota bacterium]
MTGVVAVCVLLVNNRAVPNSPEAVVVYTDGACSGNPGPGGWAWATAPDGEVSDSGGEAHSTNQ